MYLIRVLVTSVIIATFAWMLMAPYAVAAYEPLPGVAVPDWVGPVAFGAYMLLEAWLGKTDRVKPGSTLGLVVHVAKLALNLFKRDPRK